MQRITVHLCSIGLACLLAALGAQAGKPVDADADGVLSNQACDGATHSALTWANRLKCHA
jgi:hypothetical protein